ncbi:MAG: hypothetical protein OHK0057_04360 [Thermoflexibacter sp.]
MFFSSQHPSRIACIGNQEYLFFSGTSYLGMSVNPVFQEAIQEGLSKYGTNYGSSRTSNLRLAVFEELEHFLCQWTGAEQSLTMSSGFLAGQLIAQWVRDLFSKGYVISYAPHTHPAVFCGLEKIDSPDFESWVEQIVFQSYTCKQDMVLVCNSVDVLHAKVHSFEWIERLNTAKEIILVVDDSHGIGITGQNGRGVYAHIPPVKNLTKVVIASMGKALGMPAGMILSHQEIIKALKKSSFYAGASPVLPAYCYAFLKIGEEYQKQLFMLKKNIQFFTSKVKDLNLLDYAEDYPVFRTYQPALYPFLLEHRVLISSFPYPKPDSEPISRVVLSSLHRLSDLAYLVELLKLFVADIRPKIEH